MGKDKERRRSFHDRIVERANHRCQLCGRTGIKLDAHHIIPAKDLPARGYVDSNAVALCDVPLGCHWKAEHQPEHPEHGRAALFRLIGSTPEKARLDSQALANRLARETMQPNA